MQQTSSLTAIEIANQAQLLASDPRASVFVSASAGSGKTKLLVDRLLRLMLPLDGLDAKGHPTLLAGSDPARILCLTYTKAAAAEMSNRLQSHLGRWVSLSDDVLGEELRGLDVPDTPCTRREARGLFLRVLDLPGGLRIETIHAFCQSLLRRFPLEAALDPHFALMEETDGDLALRQALENELAQYPEHAMLLAGQASLQDIVGHVVELNAKAGRLAPLLRFWKQNPGQIDALYQHVLQVGQSCARDLEQEMCRPPKEDDLRAGLQAVLPKITTAQMRSVQAMLDWLATPQEERCSESWMKVLLTKEGKARAMTTVICKAAQSLAPSLVEDLTKEAQRQIHLYDSFKAHALLKINRALITLVVPVLKRFQTEKSRRGVVDYNDLVVYTRDLLREPGAAWVLYKLDGGIDHLLLDEVQDTSAQQWEIAGALTEDFFSGKSTHENQLRPRTIFAVGDFKQSIYSFQGAEPEQFHKWRRIFAERVKAAGLLWREPGLHVSFRSVAPVLSLVDSVFSHDSAAYGVLEEDQSFLEHLSARPGQGGSVELWPLVPAKETEIEEEGAVTPWGPPIRNVGQRSAPQRLAESLAGWISQQIGVVAQLGKPVLKAGDVLVLVPRRSSFLRSLIRALKVRHVPVASFIRAGLTEQIAVRDLMTLCAVLLLPQDDLGLASVLTSPLGGLSDDSLMALATDNGKKSLLGGWGRSLWDVLREHHEERPEWRAAWERLSALYRRVDYETPYGLLVQALGQHGGRARLLARLGPEAAEPLDELLTAALAYEAQHVPSLQGFLHWLEVSKASSRREAESTVDAVRIMTVHGSKGLQARLVILPDTTSESRKDRNVLLSEYEDESFPLWVPRQEMDTEVSKKIKNQVRERQRAERNRLLYVALTRARDRLVVCGWEPGNGKVAETSWYHQCVQGFVQLAGVMSEPLGLGWEGERFILTEPCQKPEKTCLSFETALQEITLPRWMGCAPEWRVAPAPVEEALARPLAPSRPEGVEFGPLPVARSPLDVVQLPTVLAPKDAEVRRVQAMLRGRLVHRLLQLLPDMPVHQRQAKAYAWLLRPAWGFSSEMAACLAGQIVAVIEDVRLAPLFAPGSRAEQAVSGTLEAQGEHAGRVVLGKVDRFSVQEGIVWLCDYKTGRRPPREVMQTPPAYLRQMAAYRAVMAGIYPGHEIRCFLVWTEGPEISLLPATLLAQFL